MERRIIYLILLSLGILLVIFSLIFGTKKRNIEKKEILPTIETKPIVVWGILDSEKMQNIIVDFERITNEKINYIYFPPEEIYKQFLENIAAGNLPDVILINNHLFEQFKDKIQPIGNKDQIDIWPFLKENLSENNDLLAFPLALDPIVLGSQKQIFYSLGLKENPATYDELNQLILNLKSKNLNIYFINLGTIENNPFAPEIITSLALNFGAQSQDIFKNYADAWSRAFNYYFSFGDKQNPLFSFEETNEELTELFLKNKILMVLAPLSFFNNLKNINPQLDFLISSFPTNNLLYRKSLVNFYMGVIPKLSSNSQQGKKFLSYFYNFPEKVYQNWKLIPSKNNYFNLEDLTEWWQKESLIAKAIIFPAKDLFLSLLRKIKIEINYNQNVGQDFINNFK